MKLLIDLFSTDSGLMSITGISFMIGMGVFFILYFKRKIAEDTQAAELRQANATQPHSTGHSAQH